MYLGGIFEHSLNKYSYMNIYCTILKMTSNTFIIAEFNDGLQLIPATWYNADNSSSIWPTHFKTKLRINKVIMTGEMPKEKLDWDILPVKKVFGTAGK